ncbi:MAG: hypothetical protein D3919_05075 [Candidatus Electrothrix sp. AW5]|nr:hypothetical protein [Candidatus Electrothrix gigas]MCI5195598.1 hypothetical protein [Candidatus Electrothrix gigas]
MIKSAFFDTLRRSFWVHVNRQSSNILLEDKNRKKGMRSSQQNRSVLILNLINIPSGVDLSNKLPYHIINLNSFFCFFLAGRLLREPFQQRKNGQNNKEDI